MLASCLSHADVPALAQGVPACSALFPAQLLPKKTAQGGRAGKVTKRPFLRLSRSLATDPQEAVGVCRKLPPY